MLLTMKAPVGRERGQRFVRCNEAQADILRKVGWTEVRKEAPLEAPLVIAEATHYIPDVDLVAKWISPPEDAEPPKATPPIKTKRKYTRRVVSVDGDGNTWYKKKPRRQYRRRDMTAEE